MVVLRAMETIRSAATESNSTEAQKLSALVDVINQVRKQTIMVLST